MAVKKTSYKPPPETPNDVKIVIDIKDRHDVDIKVTATRFASVRAVEDALALAMRRYLEFQHETTRMERAAEQRKAAEEERRRKAAEEAKQSQEA